MSKNDTRTPKYYMKDGVRHLVLPDENYEAFEGFKTLGANIISESEVQSIEEASRREIEDAIRPYTIKRDQAFAKLEAEISRYREDVIRRNRLNALVGRPLEPTPWLQPEPSREQKPYVVSEWDQQGYDDEEGYNDEAYDDLDDE